MATTKTFKIDESKVLNGEEHPFGMGFSIFPQLF